MKTLKLLLAILASLAAACPAWATSDTLIVKGRVTDHDTGNPIEGVEIRLTHEKWVIEPGYPYGYPVPETYGQAVTNAAGFYSIGAERSIYEQDGPGWEVIAPQHLVLQRLSGGETDQDGVLRLVRNWHLVNRSTYLIVDARVVDWVDAPTGANTQEEHNAVVTVHNANAGGQLLGASVQTLDPVASGRDSEGAVTARLAIRASGEPANYVVRAENLVTEKTDFQTIFAKAGEVKYPFLRLISDEVRNNQPPEVKIASIRAHWRVNDNGKIRGSLGKVTLRGAASDPNGDPLNYQWVFISGGEQRTVSSARTFTATLAPGSSTIVTFSARDKHGVWSNLASDVIVVPEKKK